jgi:RHS repeat-associated protein
MRRAYYLLLMFFFALNLYSQEGWGDWKPYSSESFYDGSEKKSQKAEERSYDLFKPRFYVSKIQNRFLKVDRFAHKYPGISPYVYVLNNPIRFTDMTGDTVDIDPALLQEVKTHDDDGNPLELTIEQKYAVAFQDWLKGPEGKAFMKDFGIGGKFGESMVNFKLSTIPGKTGIAGFFQNKNKLNDFFGTTRYGERDMNETYFSGADYPVTIEGGLKNLVTNVYFNPNKIRGRGFYTVAHEPGHVYFGADAVKRGVPIPTLQHDLPQPKSMPYPWSN